MSRPLVTPGKDRVPIVQEAGWAPRPVSCLTKETLITIAELASIFTLMYILMHRLQKCVHLTLKLKPSFLIPLISSLKIIDAFV
jgi:hypothetical protein